MSQSLRKSILTTKSVQNASDFNEVLAQREYVKKSLAAHDLVRFQMAPFLKKSTGKQKPQFALGLFDLSGSSIMKSLYSFEPGHVTLLESNKKGAADSELKSQYYAKAAEYVIEAKKSFTPASYYFEAAVLLDSINMYEYTYICSFIYVM